MIKRTFLALSATAALLLAAQPSAQALTAQQEKMKTCNAEAKTEKLKGQDRKTFLSTCLKSDADTAKRTLTAQQEKMKTCNADASAKNLKGAARRTFMSTCLKA